MEYEKVVLLKYLVMIREVGRYDYRIVRMTLDASDRNLAHLASKQLREDEELISICNWKIQESKPGIRHCEIIENMN